MSIRVRLVPMPSETGFAPLGVLGYCLTRTRFFDLLWQDVRLVMKTVWYDPQSKMLDVLVSILAGCRAISQINNRLRPDLALARAWGRPRFAEQSVVARTLDACDATTVAQLRQGSEALFRRESLCLRHDLATDWLWLDIDLTPLPSSKGAEGSTKGLVGKKNSYGRQLARVHAPQYHETLFSRIYAGNQESSPTYLPVVEAIQSFLAFTPEQRQRVILRTDAGFGSDANINQVLEDGWQVLTKNKGGRRPQAFVRQLPPDPWQSIGPNRWVASVVAPLAYCRPTQSLLLRWFDQQGEEKLAIVITSITAWSASEVIAQYDDRGACETEIQADKMGLKLERRRKKIAAAQEALVLLTDLAHNLLAWTRHWMFPTGSLARFGPLRLTEDVLCLPGRLLFDGNRLTEVQLNELHPHAEEVQQGIEQLLDHFGQP